ncbi:MAG: hypothetical protein Ct9H90mP5_10470 [Acidimicrobiaceae bacterium]|nr:MAG: hypothetical protein Ct9H90mP5_10470 [Acidimicrobiaceae bacterium]
MSHGLVHPFTKALYVKNGDGNIEVTDGDLKGIFRRDGSWLEGELRECDHNLWMGWRPQIENHRVGKVKSSEVNTSRFS